MRFLASPVNSSFSTSKRIFARTPGERAFDRCLFPYAVFFMFGTALGIIGGLRRRSPSHSRPESVLAVSPPSSAWFPWLTFGLGLILTVLWFRALISVIDAWHDPSAKVLRFVSCILLLPFAYAAFTLVSTFP